MATPAPPQSPYPYVYQSRPPPPLRCQPGEVRCYSLIRPWAIIVPFITIILAIWWYSNRSCGADASAKHECWMLWLTLPLVRPLHLDPITTSISQT